MRTWQKLAVLPLAAAFGLLADLEPRVIEPAGAGAPALTLGLAPAEAQTYRAQNRRVARRTARRTSRRTSRRQAYLHSLPPGCPLRGAYYYCGGVYYSGVVQGGSTVYVVVNP